MLSVNEGMIFSEQKVDFLHEGAIGSISFRARKKRQKSLTTLEVVFFGFYLYHVHLEDIPLSKFGRQSSQNHTLQGSKLDFMLFIFIRFLY